MPRRWTWLIAAFALALTACSDKGEGTSASVAPVTSPSVQAAACSLLSESALGAAGVPSGTTGVARDHPDDPNAPNNTCQWDGDPGVSVAVYRGRDSHEILAIARQGNPGGTDVTGIGEDAYLFGHVLFVDTGSQVFAVAGASTQDQLQALAQDVITDL